MLSENEQHRCCGLERKTSKPHGRQSEEICYAKVLSSIVNVLLQQGGRQCDYVGALIYIRAKSIPTNLLPLFAMIREDDNANFASRVPKRNTCTLLNTVFKYTV